MFTHSPGRFPEKQFKELIDTLHNNQQHLVIILDPGVHAEDGNTAYEEGKRRGIFIKIKRGDKTRSFIGRVWPGKVNPCLIMLYKCEFCGRLCMVDMFSGLVSSRHPKVLD